MHTTSVVSVLGRAGIMLVCATYAEVLRSADPDEGGSPNRALAECRIPIDGVPFTVPVTAAGRTFPFLLDTGSNYTVYDKRLRASLGDRQGQVVATPGDVRLELVSVDGAKIGTLPMPEVSAVADLSAVRDAVDPDLAGIVGMDFLLRHVIRIDFDHQKFSVLSKSSPEDGKMLGLVVNRTREAMIIAQPGGTHEYRFLVDTGCFGSGGLTRGILDELLMTGSACAVHHEPFISFGGSGDARSALVERFAMSEFSHKRLRFNERPKNILGVGYWRRYVSTFDFPGRKVYLRKSDAYDDTDDIESPDITLSRDGSALHVIEVRPHSRAAVSGLRQGDIILSIAGRQAQSMRLALVHSTLIETTRRVRLVVRRGTDCIAVTLTGEKAGEIEEAGSH